MHVDRGLFFILFPKKLKQFRKRQRTAEKIPLHLIAFFVFEEG